METSRGVNEIRLPARGPLKDNSPPHGAAVADSDFGDMARETLALLAAVL